MASIDLELHRQRTSQPYCGAGALLTGHHLDLMAGIGGIERQLRGIDRELHDAVCALAGRVARHERFMRHEVLPLFRSGERCSPSLRDGFAVDALRVLGFADRARSLAIGAESRVGHPVIRFLDRLDDHMADEAHLLGHWVRLTDRSARRPRSRSPAGS